jgi:pimeloyl-ACP methyl ester carboxylesterase
VDDYRVSRYIAAVTDVHEYALHNLPVDPTRIGLWGHSMGGLVGIHAAGRIPGIVAFCGSQPSTGPTGVDAAMLAEWRRTGRLRVETEYWGEIELPIAHYDDRVEFDSVSAMRELDLPVLLIAGTRDTTVDVASVRRIRDARPNAIDYVEFDTDHEYKRDHAVLAQINATTVDFFGRHLTRQLD